MSKKPFTLEEAKKISPSLLLRMINQAKKELKNDSVMQDICKKYKVDINEIDYIPTYFKDLDVSAKTDHGVVWLSYNLLLDGAFDKRDWSYLIHEYSHYFQQTTRNKATKSSNDANYLDNPFEQEGFQNQIEYLANEFGDDEAEDYVDNLLEHHDIDDANEFEDKKEVLMSKV